MLGGAEVPFSSLLMGTPARHTAPSATCTSTYTVGQARGHKQSRRRPEPTPSPPMHLIKSSLLCVTCHCLQTTPKCTGLERHLLPQCLKVRNLGAAQPAPLLGVPHRLQTPLGGSMPSSLVWRWAQFGSSWAVGPRASAPQEQLQQQQKTNTGCIDQKRNG